MRMNMNEFTSTLIAQLGEDYGKNYEISATTVNKANQKCCGISFRKPNTNMAAIIYIDDLYAQYVANNVCISDIMVSLQSAECNGWFCGAKRTRCGAERTDSIDNSTVLL